MGWKTEPIANHISFDVLLPPFQSSIPSEGRLIKGKSLQKLHNDILKMWTHLVFPQSRQYYIGVNHKCPESFYPIFLPDQVTQAQTWGTVVIPY